MNEVIPAEELIANRNEIGQCPCCGQNIKDRQITLYKGLVMDFYKVYKWCGVFKRHEFDMKDIRHLLNRNSYARFGDLVWFGGIVYRPIKNGPSKSHYGINMARAKEFFHGHKTIPGSIVINQLTNSIESRNPVHISQIKPLTTLITSEGLYDHEKEVYA